jgi:hypothetical protein
MSILEELLILLTIFSVITGGYLILRRRKGKFKILTKNRNYKLGDKIEGMVIFIPNTNIKINKLNLKIRCELKTPSMIDGRSMAPICLMTEEILLVGKEVEYKAKVKQQYPFVFQIPTNLKESVVNPDFMEHVNSEHKIFICLDAHIDTKGVDLHAWKVLKLAF